MYLPKYLLSGLLFLTAVTSSGVFQDGLVLNRVISVHAESQSVAAILRQITADEEIFFSFDATLVDTERIMSLYADRQRVIDILNTMFPHGEFLFLQKEDYVIITLPEEIQEPVADSQRAADTAFMVFGGRVEDLVTREPLAYVSISLQNHPIGTISNLDGEYLLKLPAAHLNDSVVFSHVGYASKTVPADRHLWAGVVGLQSVAIRIREVRVKAVSVEEILENMRRNIAVNYPVSTQLLTGFYRETLKQDEEYISVSEAIMEILKTSYLDEFREDRVRLLKARQSPDVKPFHWVNFKLQGGPYTIVRLDVVKTIESFLDKEFQYLYRFNISDVIWYKDHPVYVIAFRPVRNISFPLFRGELYIDRENYALLYARFSLDNYGLGKAEEILIKKKPRGFRVKALNADYQVDYQVLGNKSFLHSARARVAFRVRSREDHVNSVFESVSELLVTDLRNTDLRRFPGKETFSISDIFVEITGDYDEYFWEGYNIIKPDEDLKHAIKSIFPATPEAENSMN